MTSLMSDESLREQIHELLKYGLAPTPEGATEHGGSYLDDLMALIKSRDDAIRKEAEREGRQFRYIEYAPLAQIEKELADSFEAFRTAPRDGYMSGTSASSVIAANQFTLRFAAHFDKVIRDELAVLSQPTTKEPNQTNKEEGL